MVLIEEERFEEAQICQNHINTMKEIEALSTEKTKAVAQDRFEDAIDIRNKIKALENKLSHEGAIRMWRKGETIVSLVSSLNVV